MANVRSGDRPLSLRICSTDTRVSALSAWMEMRWLTGGGTVEGLPADNESLDVRVPACRARNVLQRDEVVGQAWLEELEESTRAVYAFRQ